MKKPIAIALIYGTEHERALLHKQAAQSKLSRSDYMRRLVGLPELKKAQRVQLRLKNGWWSKAV